MEGPTFKNIWEIHIGIDVFLKRTQSWVDREGGWVLGELGSGVNMIKDLMYILLLYYLIYIRSLAICI